MITPSKEFWEVFKSTNGALSCAEALAIMNIASKVPKGFWLELGVYNGKSAMAAANGGGCMVFVLVDPIFNETDIDIIGGIKKAVNYDFGIVPYSDYSTNMLPKTAEIYSYVMVDSGSHQDGIPMQEVKLLEDRVVKDGVIVFHDWNSQFSEVKEASDYLVGTGKYEYIPINWGEIVRYIDENNIEEGNQSWHHTELKNPCFVGAVRRK